MQAAAFKSNQADKRGMDMFLKAKVYILNTFPWELHELQVTKQKQFKAIYNLAAGRVVKCPHNCRDNLLQRWSEDSQ